MSLPALKQRGYTLEDWATWEGRWELIGGMAYPTYGMAPAPSLDHQRINARLLVAVFTALEARKEKGGGGDCEAFTAPVDVFLGQDVFQPDLIVVCDPAKKTARGVEGPPDLVVEILSPSTLSKDWTRKRWAYEAAGVPEYLIIDPDERVAELLRLDASGRYVSVAQAEWGESLPLLNGTLPVSLN